MLIRLEFDGRTIHQIDAEKIAAPVTMGRSRENVWPTPPDDARISGHHATLYREGKGIYVKDEGSTNKTFDKTEALTKPLKLAVGMTIRLGACSLVVEQGDPAAGQPKGHPVLVVLSGASKGREVPVSSTRVVIGLQVSADGGLPLTDRGISGQHTEIVRREDGSFWVKDLNSTNGTLINGEKLISGKERLIKNTDVLSVAHVKICFYDGSTPIPRNTVLLKLLVMGLTLFLLIGGYWAYQMVVYPRAKSLIEQAHNLARKERFDAAQAVLDKAVGSWDYENQKSTVEQLRRMIPDWRKTAGGWAQAQAFLQKSEWAKANDMLGILGSSPNEAWLWRDEAGGLRDECLRAKRLLDLKFSVASHLQDDAMTYDILRNDLRLLDETIAAAGKAPYLVPLLQELDKTRAGVRQPLQAWTALDGRMDLLKDWPLPIAKVDDALSGIRELAASGRPFVVKWCRIVTDELAALRSELAAQEDARASARAGNLKEAVTALQAQAARLRKPAVIAESRDRVLRENIFKTAEALNNQLIPVDALSGKVKTALAESGEYFRPGQHFQDPAMIRRLLDADCLSLPYPKAGARAGDYDKYLGIQEFYARIMLRDPPSDATSTPTILDRCRETLEIAGRYHAILAKPENAWILDGQVGESDAAVKAQILDPAGAIQGAMLRAVADTKAPARSRIIAGALAVTFCLAPETLKAPDGSKLQDWLVAETRKLSRELVPLDREYEGAPPERQLEIIRSVLKGGLPGDPLTKKMWLRRPAE